MQVILQEPNNHILNFITEYVRRLAHHLYGPFYDSNMLSFAHYMTPYKSGNPSPPDGTNIYPVGQTWAIKDTPALMEKDFFSLWNFVRIGWLRIIQGSAPTFTTDKFIDRNCDIGTFTSFAIVEIIQTRINIIALLPLRGHPRQPQGIQAQSQHFPPLEPEPNEYDLVGITTLRSNYLKRHLPNNGGQDRAIPWQHTGQGCAVRYLGKYGERIKNYRSRNNTKDNYFGSVQCGISASSLFILYTSLMSGMLVNQPGKVANDSFWMSQVRAITTIAFVYLIGDGGHNIREVLSGLAIHSILLKAISRHLDATLPLALAGFPDAPTSYADKDIIPQLFLDKLVFLVNNLPQCAVLREDEKIQRVWEMVLFFKRNQQFIDTFYEHFIPYNPIGVFTTDIPPGITVGTDEQIFFYMFTDSVQLSPPIDIQVFIANDARRCDRDPDIAFKNWPNWYANEVFGNYKMKDIINRRLDEHIKTHNCQLPRQYDNTTGRWIPVPIDQVPFA